VSVDLPDGAAAVAISAPADQLESHLVWRADDHVPTLTAFLEVARGVFDTA
jgi:hypothetical protein